MVSNAEYLRVPGRAIVVQPARRAGSLLAFVAITLSGAVVAGGIAVGGVLRRALEPMRPVAREAAALAGSDATLETRSGVYDRKGRLIAILHGEQNREPLRLPQIAPALRKAVLAIEDARFHEHDGVDIRALARALVVNAKSGRVEQGGGTVTMQLARLAYVRDRRKTMDRKMQEIIVARGLERRFSKHEILERYLNTVYFGEGAYGAQAASETYFGIPAAKLDLAQAALLAGLIRSPEALDPRRNPEGALARRRLVLAAMEREGMIKAGERRAAARSPLRLEKRRRSLGIRMIAGSGASFVEHVKRELLDDPRLGPTREARADRLFGGGLRIETTVDLRAQRAAERTIRETLDAKGDPAAALASVDSRNGEIRALAGARDPRGYNLASQGRRQPGSAFKPFTLIAALEAGVGVQDRFDGSAPQRIGLPGGQTWLVHNYEGSPGGRMSVLQATEQSVNAVYAQLVMKVGAERVVDVARRMGVTSPLDPFPSISLGGLRIGVSPLELANAYATMANGGIAYRPIAVRRVGTSDGRTVLENRPDGKRALRREIADKAAAVMQRVVTNGTGRRALALGRPAAGKTGTTDDYHNSWFAGFTPELATAVWIGYADAARPLYNVQGWRKVFGGSLPAMMWTEYMIEALSGEPVRSFRSVNLGADRGRDTVAVLGVRTESPAPARSTPAPRRAPARRPAAVRPAPEPEPEPSRPPAPKPSPSPKPSPPPPSPEPSEPPRSPEPSPEPSG